MKRKSILNLENEIKNAAQKYYTGNSIMSDEAFDTKVEQLRNEDPDNELLTKVGWGFNVANVKGAKLNHLYGLVGSLAKIHHTSEIPAKFNELMVLSSKLDGGSCVAYYQDGKLIHALSRGDGTTGLIKDAQYNKIIEKYNLNMGSFTGGIRGEIVISNDNWQRYLEKYPDAKSPRNVATGLFMRDDVSEDLKFVDFVVYKIIGSTEKYAFYLNILERLGRFGFPIVEHIAVVKSSISDEFLTNLFNSWETYPMDGIVLQDNELPLLQKVDSGYVYNYTEVAYKFKAEEKITTVTKVEWNLSKNNIYVPLICVESIELSGATVSKTSGFNYKYIVDNKIGVGAQVRLMRSGEVIPYITEVVNPAETVDVPTVCEKCGAALTNDGVELICNNPECANIKYARLYNWIEVIGVRDILGVGPSMINSLIDKIYNVFGRDDVDIKDLYLNHFLVSVFKRENTLLTTPAETIIDEFTPAAAQKIKQIFINLSKSVTISQVLQGLNIRGLGKIICDKIAPNIQAWSNDHLLTHIDDIEYIDGLGPAVKNIVENNLKTIELILSLLWVKTDEISVSTRFYEQITVTGALSVPRKQFETEVKQYGFMVSDNIKSSKYLVTNDPNSGSSKLKKAEKYSIPILSEQEFRFKYLK